MRPSRLVCLIVVIVCGVAAGCEVSGRGREGTQFVAPKILLQRPTPSRASIQGVTRAEHRVFRAIMGSAVATPIRTLRLGAGRDGRRSGRWAYFYLGRTDADSSTKGKWIAMYVAAAFAEASARARLPRIRGITIRTDGLSAEEGGRLTLRLRARPRPTVTTLNDRRVRALARRAASLGVEVRQLTGLRSVGAGVDAIALKGRLRNASTYLRVLSETVGSGIAGRAVYYELEDESGNMAMRFGVVNGFQGSRGLVAWVRPDLLSRY